jgi:Flp pilus assembly pilin Flp
MLMRALGHQNHYHQQSRPEGCGRTSASFEKGGTVLSALHREEGQGLAEYALILVFIALAAIVAVAFFGANLSTLLSTIGESVGSVL